MAEKFSAEERELMRERARELKAAKGAANKAADEALVIEKIAAMAPEDRALAQRIHDLVKIHAPQLDAKTWYGMQAYFKDGKVVCFFQDGGKFRTRYCTLGFQEAAALDDGLMWPTSYALLDLDAVTERQIIELLVRASA